MPKEKTTKAQRDPKTGRFLPKADQASKSKSGTKQDVKVKVKSTTNLSNRKPKTVKEPRGPQGSSDPHSTLKVSQVLQSPLEVFIKKDITGKSKNILAGNEITIEKLPVLGPTGTNVYRIKRTNCERTYYTIEERVPK